MGQTDTGRREITSSAADRRVLQQTLRAEESLERLEKILRRGMWGLLLLAAAALCDIWMGSYEPVNVILIPFKRKEEQEDEGKSL
jgi:hypothetical protein